LVFARLDLADGQLRVGGLIRLPQSSLLFVLADRFALPANSSLFLRDNAGALWAFSNPADVTSLVPLKRNLFPMDVRQRLDWGFAELSAADYLVVGEMLVNGNVGRTAKFQLPSLAPQSSWSGAQWARPVQTAAGTRSADRRCRRFTASVLMAAARGNGLSHRRSAGAAAVAAVGAGRAAIAASGI
jgi:hypothetical protein